ncbi:S-adenosyl-L-methionine-dependent methyltransferase [Pyrenochaeta sp. DS3sAY3a]|nr:S-adenosyl-L-methionine-dependent methyltransferase [Pyrenochaeta sp. DS3sAY3a]
MAFLRTPIRYNRAAITSTAAQLTKLSAQITTYLSSNNHAQPTFAADSPTLPETPEYEALRNQATDSALDLLRLVNGPKNTFRTLFFSHTDLAAAQVALSRRFFAHVPNDGVGISASEVAAKAGMDADRATRVLKMLATHRIFEEADGRFRHTAASAFLADSVFSAMCEASLDDFFKASAEMNGWVEGSPFEMGAENSPFVKRFGVSFYREMEVKWKALRFSKAMDGWSLIDDNFAVLRDNFDWASLKNTKVVDVGGGNGHVSLDLARKFPDLTFTVQDLSQHQLDSTAASYTDRIKFQQYNFFEPQPIRDAGIYLCRAIFHNHNDAESVLMLKALLPALENRSDDPRILLNDVVVPERAEGKVTRSEENQHRQLDLLMLALFGAKERTKKDWVNLLREVDERLEIVKMEYNPRGAGLLEIRLGKGPKTNSNL